MNQSTKESLEWLSNTIENYRDESRTLPFYYGMDFMLKANRIIQESGFNPQDIEKPFLVEKELKAPYNRNESLEANFFYFQFKNNPKYIFEFTEPLKGRKSQHNGGLYVRISPNKNGISDKYSIITSPQGDTTNAALSSFKSWLDNVVNWENKLKEFEETNQPLSEVINLNEDKPFNAQEVKLLEKHFSNVISNIKSQLQRLPDEKKKQIGNAIPEIEKILEQSIGDAKNINLTKKGWHQEFSNKIVRFIKEKIIAKLPEKVIDYLIKWIFGKIVGYFILSSVILNIQESIEPEHNDLIPQIQNHIDAIDNINPLLT